MPARGGLAAATGLWNRSGMSSDTTEEIPSDEDVAADMEAFAQIFVDGAAAEGQEFGWDAASAGRLDGLCEAFLASRPDEDAIQSMVLAMGSYLGELVVRNGHGHWTYDTRAAAAGVDVPSRKRCFPHSRVGQRLTIGAAHSLRLFYQIAVTGPILPGQPASTPGTASTPETASTPGTDTPA